jgi:hypothetical protein
MTDAPLAHLVAEPGPNDVEWVDPNLPGHPLTLRSARPRAWTPDMPVLFVHHGVQRNGGDYRDYWLPLVDEARVLVVAPEFSDEFFPGSHWYNYGNRTDHDGHLRPRAQWTYGVPGRIFESLKAQGLTTRATSAAFGHSAGGQFLHRMVSLGFRAHLSTAITANAGSYAMPVLGTGFPFGLDGTGVTESDLRDLFAFPLTVMAGTADIDASSPHFPREPEAMRQGPTRFARAHAYIETARAEAARLVTPCTWTIINVPDVGHDGARMSAAAVHAIARLTARQE